MTMNLIYPAIITHLITIGLFINSEKHDKYLLLMINCVCIKTRKSVTKFDNNYSNSMVQSAPETKKRVICKDY